MYFHVLATNTAVVHANKTKVKLLLSELAVKIYQTFIYMKMLQIIASQCTPVKTSTLLVLLVMLCFVVF